MHRLSVQEPVWFVGIETHRDIFPVHDYNNSYHVYYEYKINYTETV